MDWFKKHADTVVILGAVLGCALWMNTKFNQIEKDITVVNTPSAKAEGFSRLRGLRS